jgi:hypothetical protein
MCARGVSERVGPLLFAEDVGGFKIHAIERVGIDRYIVPMLIELSVDDHAIRYTSIRKEQPSPLGRIRFLSASQSVDKSHYSRISGGL